MCVSAASEDLVGQGELGAAGRRELWERCKLPDKVRGRAARHEATTAPTWLPPEDESEQLLLEALEAYLWSKHCQKCKEPELQTYAAPMIEKLILGCRKDQQH